MEFQLYRNKGVLLFNSSNEKIRYWVSIQAAAHGGGSMYAEISKEDFEDVWSGKKDVIDLNGLFNRNYNRQAEQAIETAYSLESIISLHIPNLGSNADPVKSVVLKQC
ncbi:hypothetical protein GCM10011613_01720 [Cellvibrio zantedeschiae]|uniref:Uncharacterized protein n=1 Tax=Cellvibrio zantedeschiae TaxID=1237077 RepID=A0ABQ3ARS3_9GAMM|nr:hypothetical protein [Cellvibrio zantedeschiae]GGY61925.1 hypothetical protein GCM10011613_01720 [Cellvibrio zantedeschiae]